MNSALPRTLCAFAACAFLSPWTSAELVAHWPLDDDASDATGNGHDGLVVGGTVTFGQPGANGNTGTSAEFPDNGHIDIPYDPAISPGDTAPDGSSSFTVTLWAYSTDNTGYNSPFTGREDSGNVNGPIIYNNPQGNWSYWAGNNGPSGAWNPINDGPVPLDTWVHVAIVFDADTITRKMYVDGVEVINQAGGVSANSQRDLHIGSGQDDGNNFFWNGRIDDVGLWNEALSEAEINSIMTNGITSGAADPKLQVPERIRLDYDGGNGNFDIEIGNGGESQNLNIIGTPTITGPNLGNFSILSVPGPIAPGGTGTLACNFDPDGGNGIFEATFEIQSDDSLQATRMVTVQMTVHDPFLVAPNSVELEPLPSGAGPRTTTITLENMGSRSLQISDVTLEGPDAAKFSVAQLTSIDGGASVDLELTFTPGGEEGTFVANIVINSDDPLTPSLTIPVSIRVDFAQPLIAWWPLDSDPLDASGNGFDGEVVGGTVVFDQPGATPNTGSAASFPDNGHIDVLYDAALNPGVKAPNGAESFSVVLWAYSTSNSGYNSPFTAREDSGTVNGPIIYNDPNGNWSYWAGNNGPAGAWNPINDGPVPLDTWVHVAITYDSATTTRKMFIDGAEVINQPGGVSANSQRNLHIGSGQDDGNNFFWNGLIDDVALFRIALNEQEINEIISKGVSGFIGAPRIRFDVEDAGNDMLTLRWDSQGGKLYNLRGSTDLATAPLDWTIYDGNQNIAATPPENTLTIPRPALPEHFFIVEEFPAPPETIYSTDFENGADGWTTGSDGAVGTTWALGTPTGFGPGGANSPVNCFGTNLDGEYGTDADVWLRSPEIDLTTAGGATLQYYEYLDVEGDPFDYGILSVLDATDDSVLGVLDPSIDGAFFEWQQSRSFKLPAEALGKRVKIEFRFQSDNIQNFTGWYVDDVVVTVP